MIEDPQPRIKELLKLVLPTYTNYEIAKNANFSIHFIYEIYGPTGKGRRIATGAKFAEHESIFNELHELIKQYKAYKKQKLPPVNFANLWLPTSVST